MSRGIYSLRLDPSHPEYRIMGWEEYDGFVVIADSGFDARVVVTTFGNASQIRSISRWGWIVTHLGSARGRLTRGIVMSSYRNG
jgi:hypothetical protein